MKFTLTIDCDNVSFEGDPRPEVERILIGAADGVECASDGITHTLLDLNGNRVGSMCFVPPPRPGNMSA